VTLTPHNAAHGVLRSPLRGITGCRGMRRNGETIEGVVETLVALSADKHFCLPPHTKGRRFQPFEAEWLTVRLGGAGKRAESSRFRLLAITHRPSSPRRFLRPTPA
jgi:hypothetical protein